MGVLRILLASWGRKAALIKLCFHSPTVLSIRVLIVELLGRTPHGGKEIIKVDD